MVRCMCTWMLKYSRACMFNALLITCSYVYLLWWLFAHMFLCSCVLIFTCFYVHMLWWSYTSMFTYFDDGILLCLYALMRNVHLSICLNAHMLGHFYDWILPCYHASLITSIYVHMPQWWSASLFTCFDDHMSTCLYAFEIICLDALMITDYYFEMLQWLHAHMYWYSCV